jgi:hypothetical protein
VSRRRWRGRPKSSASEVFLGHRRFPGNRRTLERIGSAARAVIYAVLGWSAVRVVTGGGGGGQHADALSAQLMALPGGQLLVSLVGAGIIAVGGYLAYKGVTAKFTEELSQRAKAGEPGTLVRRSSRLRSAGCWSLPVPLHPVGPGHSANDIRRDQRRPFRIPEQEGVGGGKRDQRSDRRWTRRQNMTLVVVGHDQQLELAVLAIGHARNPIRVQHFDRLSGIARAWHRLSMRCQTLAHQLPAPCPAHKDR